MNDAIPSTIEHGKTDAATGPDRAWVVFRDCASPWWRVLLRPGFGHCLVVVPAPAHWLVMDPLSHFTDLGAVPRDEIPDLPARFRDQGMTVVDTVVHRDADTPAPWAPFTCVEAVKRVLGLRDPKVFTPWRLYRALVGARGDAP